MKTAPHRLALSARAALRPAALALPLLLGLAPTQAAEAPATSSPPLEVRPPPNGRAQRQMDIMTVKDLGLEIWRELEPEPWSKALQGNPAGSGKDAVSSPMLVLQSPAKVYPPTALAFTSLRGQKVAEGDFQGFAQGLFDAMVKRLNATGPVRLRAATYGVLTGWEAEVTGEKGPDAVDTRMFVGQSPGKWPVLLQVQVLPGKLAHASEFIRRGWTNVRYLPQ
jgi:hypothetical protein